MALGKRRHRKTHTEIVGSSASHATNPADTDRYTTTQYLKMTIRLLKLTMLSFWRRHKIASRITAVFLLLVILFSVFNQLFRAKIIVDKYDITGQVSLLLDEPIQAYAEKLTVNPQTRAIQFNDSYTEPSDLSGDSISPKITASFEPAPNSSVTVNDPTNQVGITFKPKFKVDEPLKDSNRVLYPIVGKPAINVYTLKGTGIKEDIVLTRYPKTDELQFDYELQLPDGLEARMESDGSLAVYGADSSLLGNVTTGSDSDAELLKNARDNAEKTTLIFRIPAPFIVQSNGKPSAAKSWFSYNNNILSIHANNLRAAQYPLSIDPSVYVETATKLMRGNNESNIEFDVANELIQKGATTGARFDRWNSTLGNNASRWNAGTAVAGGFVYSVGGAKSDTSMYTIPGTSQYVVPSGVTSVTIKTWGGGAGGGGSSTDRAGGAGGGAGYVISTISVTAGEVLTINVGGGGLGGRSTGPDVMGNGGAGGGYSGVLRGATPLLIAAGGGAGGGGNGDTASVARAVGSAGGAGGGTSGVAGTSNGSTTGGGGGTPSAGGAAGSSTTTGGTAGSSLQGGKGASSVSLYNDATTFGAGGAGGYGETGVLSANKLSGGGGGGGGYYGGGGGGRGNANYNGGGGGGGGSSYTTGSSVTNTAGSGVTPGNSVDADRNSAGTGGAGGVIGPNNGTAGSPGIVLITASSSSATATNEVYWARFNTSSESIETTNPGNGTCSNWCTNSNYNLPANRVAHSLVAYNGFLYALGGTDGTTRASTVYIAKIGVNGEPSLWHPTSTNKNDWVYWYSSASTLSTERSYTAAAAYNNRLYLLGGQTNASGTSGVNTVEYTEIKPTGDLGSWSTSGMVVMPSARHNHNIHIYNDRMYLVGGATSNTTASLLSTVHQIKIASDGTMSGSWIAANSFSSARIGWGGTFSVIWGGYLYLSGGCTALTTGYCSTVASDIQLASINADGSLTDWNTIIGVTNQRTSYSLVAWRNALYGIGGCRQQNTSTGVCTWGTSATDYGLINPDGDASTVSNSVASGVAPCSGVSPYDCDTPPEGSGNGQGGRMSGSALVNNGFLYYFGGCHTAAKAAICFVGSASKTSDNIYYASIGSDGKLTKPATCVGTYYGSWCVDNSNTIPSGGIAGAGATVFNNVAYLVGGTDGAAWQGTVYRVTLNNDGSLGAWTTQTFTNLALGGERGYPYVFSRANPGSASTYPGNLYVIGGCAGSPITDDGVDCSDVQYTTVYKCNIMTTGALEEADANDCDTSGQVQLDSEPSTGGSQGLGVMAGTVYANYIYLVGGQSPNEQERGTVMYAKIDNSNNIVDADGETLIDDIWTTSGNSLNPVRRRGVAFGYNGYLYALAGYNSGNTLNDLLFAKIDVSDGSISAFSESEVTVNPRWDLRAVVNNGYVYALGGCSNGTPPQDCNTMTGTVQTFQLYNNYSGSPSAYSASSNLFTTDRIGAGTAVLNGYIYIAGGCTTTTDCTTATDNTQYAVLNTDGTIGTWANTTDNTLPAVRSWGKLVAAGGSLYYIGGQASGSTNGQAEVYYATPASGNISAWNTASNGLPSARTQFGAAVWNDRIYVTGGRDGSSASTTTVYMSPQLSSGGDITTAWNTSTSFNVARSGHVTIAYANNLYVLGGYDGTNYLNDVQYTQINSDATGTVDSWGYSASLPGRLRQADGFAANGYMYLFGGRSADTTCVSNTIVAPISANTTITSGNNPTGVGEWYETNVKYTGDRYGGSVAYSEGRAFVLGGGCGATITFTGANRIVQTTVQSQPQIARYSRMIDTDTDVFPTYWLMNGLDNSIGARWYMRYRSMNDIDGVATDCGTADMSTWGQETNYGQVTLGTPAVYTPKDGSGANINCARYYYMIITIDSSQAYGYPEDVSRGPTIADLSLFFTSDPSKRLRHGKTFTGGEQQPLDTPF